MTLRSAAALAAAFHTDPQDVLRWPDSRFQVWAGYSASARALSMPFAMPLLASAGEPEPVPEPGTPELGRANAERILSLIDSGAGPSRRRLERKLGIPADG